MQTESAETPWLQASYHTPLLHPQLSDCQKLPIQRRTFTEPNPGGLVSSRHLILCCDVNPDQLMFRQASCHVEVWISYRSHIPNDKAPGGADENFPVIQGGYQKSKCANCRIRIFQGYHHFSTFRGWRHGAPESQHIHFGYLPTLSAQSLHELEKLVRTWIEHARNKSLLVSVPGRLKLDKKMFGNSYLFRLFWPSPY